MTISLHYQENHALNCMDIEELWRIRHEETERARQLRTDEICMLKRRRTYYDESALVSDPDSARQR